VRARGGSSGPVQYGNLASRGSSSPRWRRHSLCASEAHPLFSPSPPPAPGSCLSGCECPPTRFNGHSEDKKSLLVLHRLFATQHPECVLGVEVLPDSDSGEHKVKLAGAIVSDQSGDQEGLGNAGAVEHVHDISFRRGRGGGVGVFDIRNHV
jgi:hypothetical protein